MNNAIYNNLESRRGSLFSSKAKLEQPKKLILDKNLDLKGLGKKASSKILKRSNIFQTLNLKPSEKLDEIKNKHASTKFIPRESINKKNKIKVAEVDSINNKLENSSQTENYNLNLKANRNKKSITQSNMEKFLSLTPKINSPEVFKNHKPDSNKKQSSNKITNIPKFMNELIKNSKNHNQNDRQNLSNNIINIVNNLDQNSDKKIALKVNVNQYDLKFFVPSDAVEEDFYSQTDQENMTGNKTISEIDHSDSTNNNVKIYQLSKAKNKRGGVSLKLNKDLKENEKKHELNEQPNLDITAKFNLTKKGQKKTLKMNSLMVNPLNILPKCNLSKTLTLNENMRYLKSLNSIKSIKLNNKLGKKDEDFNSQFSFLKKGTFQISENVTGSVNNFSEYGGDVTFNKEFNNTLNNNNKSLFTSYQIEAEDRLNANEIESSNSNRENTIIQSNSSKIAQTNENNFKSSSYKSSIKEDTINSIEDIKLKDKSNYRLELEIKHNKNLLYKQISQYKNDEILDEDEMIGYEIKEKVREILSSIIDNFELSDEEIDLYHNSYSRDLRNNIKSISDNDLIKKFKSSKKSVMPRFSTVNTLALKQFHKSLKFVSSNKKLGLEDKNIKLKLNFFTQLNSSTESNKPNNLITFYNKNKREELEKIKLNLFSSNNHLQIKLVEIDSNNLDSKEKLLLKGFKYIKILIKERIKNKFKSIRKKKSLAYYFKGLNINLNKFLDEEDVFRNKLETPEDINLIKLFKEYNLLIQEKYLNIFNESMFQINNEEINFSRTNLRQKSKRNYRMSIFSNFLVNKRHKSSVTSSIVQRINSLFVSSDTGSKLLKIIGNKNMAVINNLIMRDCIHIFNDVVINDNDKKKKKRSSNRRRSRLLSKEKVKICYREMKRSTVCMYNNPLIKQISMRSSKTLGIVKIKNFTESEKEDSFQNVNLSNYVDKFNKDKSKNKKNYFPTKNQEKNINNVELLKDLSILDKNTMFNRSIENYESNNKHKKQTVQEMLDKYFAQSPYLPMTKENTIFRTHEIKTNILRILETPMEILSFHIRDGNLHKFRDTFERHKIVVDCTDKNSNSLVNLAVQCGNYEIVSYLINLGADVNLQNIFLNSPLHYALSHNNFKLADLLISKKADQELANLRGLTPWQCLGIDSNEIDMLKK